jgi:hypothetical protein
VKRKGTERNTASFAEQVFETIIATDRKYTAVAIIEFDNAK